MEDAVKQVITEGKSGNKVYFYDAFKSQNERLKRLQIDAFDNRHLQSTESLNSASNSFWRKLIFKIYRFLYLTIILVPLFLYLAVYLFIKGNSLSAFLALFSGLGCSFLFIWRDYFRPVNIIV